MSSVRRAVDYLQEELGERESLDVIVDVEDVLYEVKPGVADVVNQCVQYYEGENPELDTGSFDSWDGVSSAAEVIGDALGWRKKEYSENFFEGAEKWPGFHEASDIVWTGETGDYEWLENVKSPRPVENAAEDLSRLWHIEGVTPHIVTSRGNWFSDYDVEKGLEEKLYEDLTEESLGRDDIRRSLSFSRDKISGEPVPDVVIDDSPARAAKIQQKTKMAALVPETPQNISENVEHKVDSFGTSVDALAHYVEGDELSG